MSSERKLSNIQESALGHLAKLSMLHRFKAPELPNRGSSRSGKYDLLENRDLEEGCGSYKRSNEEVKITCRSSRHSKDEVRSYSSNRRPRRIGEEIHNRMRGSFSKAARKAACILSPKKVPGVDDIPVIINSTLSDIAHFLEETNFENRSQRFSSQQNALKAELFSCRERLQLKMRETELLQYAMDSLDCDEDYDRLMLNFQLKSAIRQKLEMEITLEDLQKREKLLLKSSQHDFNTSKERLLSRVKRAVKYTAQLNLPELETQLISTREAVDDMNKRLEAKESTLASLSEMISENQKTLDIQQEKLDKADRDYDILVDFNVKAKLQLDKLKQDADFGSLPSAIKGMETLEDLSSFFPKFYRKVSEINETLRDLHQKTRTLNFVTISKLPIPSAEELQTYFDSHFVATIDTEGAAYQLNKDTPVENIGYADNSHAPVSKRRMEEAIAQYVGDCGYVQEPLANAECLQEQHGFNGDLATTSSERSVFPIPQFEAISAANQSAEELDNKEICCIFKKMDEIYWKEFEATSEFEAISAASHSSEDLVKKEIKESDWEDFTSKLEVLSAAIQSSEDLVKKEEIKESDWEDITSKLEVLSAADQSSEDLVKKEEIKESDWEDFISKLDVLSAANQSSEDLVKKEEIKESDWEDITSELEVLSAAGQFSEDLVKKEEIKESDWEDCTSKFEVLSAADQSSEDLIKKEEIKESDWEDFTSGLEVLSAADRSSDDRVKKEEIKESDWEDFTSGLEVLSAADQSSEDLVKKEEIEESDWEDCTSEFEARSAANDSPEDLVKEKTNFNIEEVEESRSEDSISEYEAENDVSCSSGTELGNWEVVDPSTDDDTDISFECIDPADSF